MNTANNVNKGFPGGTVLKSLPSSAGDTGLMVQSLIGKIPWKRKWQASNILAWRIPWTEQPGRLQSMGLQRVGHN